MSGLGTAGTQGLGDSIRLQKAQPDVTYGFDERGRPIEAKSKSPKAVAKMSMSARNEQAQPSSAPSAASTARDSTTKPTHLLHPAWPGSRSRGRANTQTNPKACLADSAD